MKDEYILGGYFVIQAAARSSCMNINLLPDKILSVSECVCNVIPNTWALSWTSKTIEDIEQADYNRQLLDVELIQLEEWTTQQFNKGNIGWQYGFSNLVTAQEFCKKFLKTKDDIYILGIGLSQEDTTIFIEEEEPTKGMGSTLVYDVLCRNEVIDSTELLGFDVLGFDIGYFHSYICNGLENEFNARFDIKPNEYGLYNSYSAARLAAKYLMTDEAQVEPALWLPWVVCKFDLEKHAPI